MVEHVNCKTSMVKLLWSVVQTLTLSYDGSIKTTFSRAMFLFAKLVCYRKICWCELNYLVKFH